MLLRRTVHAAPAEVPQTATKAVFLLPPHPQRPKPGTSIGVTMAAV